MPTNVDVPALGESVQEATLIKWHKNDGELVKIFCEARVWEPVIAGATTGPLSLNR